MMDELHPQPFVCALSSFALSIVIPTLLNTHSLNVVRENDIKEERKRARKRKINIGLK